MKKRGFPFLRARKRHRPLITEHSQAFSFTRRAIVLGVGQGALATALGVRMGWLSIAENEHYKLLAESNRVQERLIPPRRGWIVDRYNQPIAINRSSFRVDLIPQRMEKDPTRVLNELTQLIGLTQDDLDRIREGLANAAGYQPVPVAENLPYDKYAAVTVRLSELPGVAPLRSFARFYPEGPAVAHLVGYVGTPSKEEYQAENKEPLLIAPGFKIGKDELEKTMEHCLRGKPGAQRIEVTAHGKLVRELSTRPDESGGMLPLTIDAGLHSYAARRLGDESGALVVIDCRTGEVLAMASMPAYDPNIFSQGISHREWNMLAADERHPMINKVLQGLYPSGSTIKPTMSLAFLQAGLDPKAKVNCTGAYRVGNAIFHCDKHHGPVDMHEAIIKSCDIYFYHTSLQAGADVISAMAHKLGFGDRFELPFPTQRFGTIPDPDWMQRKYHRKWEMYDTINMSIGQGNVLVNPLQLAIMAGRIASGRAIEPKILREAAASEAPPLPVTPEHLAFVRDAMSGVVNSGRGTASIAKLPIDGVLIGGKTGTAQVRRITMAERNSGGVRSNASLAWKMRDHSLFVAFGPVDNPRYAAAAVIEHGGWGATVAAPMVRDTLLYLFDKQKALAALAPLEEQWGGSITERMARRREQFQAATATQKNDSDEPPPPTKA
ncbi:MAG TPA: penicillin-binding protein 2 [Allosphingosinicella sp.]|jgi:penicillin-binding protein 2|nr:penicillin-binding protein 2 [Allosphingosinicella sp.]